MKAPLVFIVIPCFNYGRYLSEAIESALAQTHQPVEVIVVDDGSTDDTAEVAGSYGDKITYIHQDNQGLAAARNSGLERATGDYLIFLDADDILDPDYAAAALEVFEKGDDDLAFVYSQLEHFGRETKVTSFPEFDPGLLRRYNYVNATSVIRRSAIGDLRFDPAFKGGWEDWDFFLSLVERGYRGRLLDRPLVRYRKHGGEGSMEDRFRNRHLNRKLLGQIYRKHWRSYRPAELARLWFKLIVLWVPGGDRLMARLGRPI